MTDLHVHILPGVDDGSPNLSTSLEMAEMAAQSGVRILAVTPHANQTGIEGVEDGYVNYESEQLEEQFYRLEREINREHIPISLVRGMEIMSIGPLGEKIRERKLIPLHESRYYLIEVPFDMAPDGIRKRLLEFPAMGKIPVLAHPERYFCVQDTPELLYEFREMGAVLQINKGSVFGRFGEESWRTVRFSMNRPRNENGKDAGSSKNRKNGVTETKGASLICTKRERQFSFCFWLPHLPLAGVWCGSRREKTEKGRKLRWTTVRFLPASMQRSQNFWPE